MSKFKVVATSKVELLLFVFVLGSFFLMLPARQPNACGRDFHVLVFRTHHFLVLTVVAAAMVLFLARIKVSSAEAEATRAMQEGLGANAAKWPSVSLRALLLLGVVLSFAASLLAVATLEDGFWYWTGCDADQAGQSAVSPVGVGLMVVMALVHGSSAWTAVFDN